MQTLRFVTALVCSATVTTAVAMPMAIKAMSYEPPVGLGAAASSLGATAERDPETAPPTTAAPPPPAPPAVAGATVNQPPTTAAPAPTTTPAAPAPVPSTTVVADVAEVQVAEEPEPVPATTAAPPTTVAPPPNTNPAPTTTTSTPFDVLFGVKPCGPNAQELNTSQSGAPVC